MSGWLVALLVYLDGAAVLAWATWRFGRPFTRGYWRVAVLVLGWPLCGPLTAIAHRRMLEQADQPKERSRAARRRR